MKKDFKINLIFDENGEKLEKIISNFLINMLEKTSINRDDKNV